MTSPCSYNPSPFQVSVQPALFDLARCEAAGSGLSLATAGVSANVYVTLRDRFGNFQPGVAAGSITLNLNNGTVAIDVTDCSGGLCPSVMTGPYLASPPYVAFPSSKPVYVLSYIATVSGSYSLAVIGVKSFASGVTRLPNSIIDSPFDLNVKPSLPCAAMSAFTVSPLAALPAQVMSLSLTSRDAYGNPQLTVPLAIGRSATSSVMDTVVTNWNSSSSSSSTAQASVRNRYDAQLLAPTTAGTNTVFGSLGLAGSLVATYYSAASSVTSFPSSIDFSVASGGVFQTFSATFSARYAGAIMLTQASVHTFRIRNVGTADRFSLVVANKVLVNMLSAAPAANADTTATVSLPLSCSMYDVSVQYVCTGTSAGRGITLSVVASGVYVVPQLSMWYAIHTVASVPVDISAGPTCASKSAVVGYAATSSLLTAGIPSAFTIQAVDAWGNLLKNSDGVFSFAAVPYFTEDTITRSVFAFHPPATTTASQLNVNDASYDDHTLTVAASVAALGSGRYAVSYSATRSGWYFMRGTLTQAGGLYGVYSESVLFVDGGSSFVDQPQAQRVDGVVDFEWGDVSPLNDWLSGWSVCRLCLYD
jgi:hypothetical protein